MMANGSLGWALLALADPDKVGCPLQVVCALAGLTLHVQVAGLPVVGSPLLVVRFLSEDLERQLVV